MDDDLDEDGFNNDVDCDDTNAEINPDATEVPYDGIDNDCDPCSLRHIVYKVKVTSFTLDFDLV